MICNLIKLLFYYIIYLYRYIRELLLKDTKNIFLIGLMGSGKTTIGKILSKTLNKDFYDSDHVVEEKTGVKVPLIFEYEGEVGFRTREERVLKDLVFHKNIVLATGGGVILSKNNCKLLSNNGHVIYLKSNCDDLVARMTGDQSRPLLQEGDLKENLETLFKIRDPIYASISDYIIETAGKRAKEISYEIESLTKQL
jgi:shikimate kinase